MSLTPEHYFSEFYKNHDETPWWELYSWSVMDQPYFFYVGTPFQVGSTHQLIAWALLSSRHPRVPKTQCHHGNWVPLCAQHMIPRWASGPPTFMQAHLGHGCSPYLQINKKIIISSNENRISSFVISMLHDEYLIIN